MSCVNYIIEKNTQLLILCIKKVLGKNSVKITEWSIWAKNFHFAYLKGTCFKCRLCFCSAPMLMHLFIFHFMYYEVMKNKKSELLNSISELRNSSFFIFIVFFCTVSKLQKISYGLTIWFNLALWRHNL